MPVHPARAGASDFPLSVRGVRWGAEPRDPLPRIRTGFVEFDVLLGGGLPRGVITHLIGAESSGRTALVYALVGAATVVGESAAWIDLPDAFDAEHAATAGIALSRLLWVRPREFKAALRATELVLETGGFAVTVADLTDPCMARRSMPPAVWVRLARAAARTRSAVVSTGVPPGMLATLCLETERSQTNFIGNRGPLPLFEGIRGIVRVRKNKLGLAGLQLAARFFVTCVP